MDRLGKYDFCATKVREVALRVLFAAALPVLVPVGVVLGAAGIAVRAIGAALRTEDFSHWRGEAAEKMLGPDRTFSVLSWNACLQPGGMSRSHGGMVEPSQRIDAVLEQIEREDPDVLALFEMQDTVILKEIAERLKTRYAHFYVHNGLEGHKDGGGILIASKYAVSDYSFHRFKDFNGVAKWVNKGFATFSLESEGQKFGRLFATHMQWGSPEESSATREKQLQQILDFAGEAYEKEGTPLFLAGDVNIDRDSEEFPPSLLASHFIHGYNDPAPTATDYYALELWDRDARPGPGERIDYVSQIVRLPSGKKLPVDSIRKTVRLVAANEPGNDQILPRSDHHALYAEVKV
jgi:endonuclease/exonuclease/phosphatase family metal-dependent hydrolase